MQTRDQIREQVRTDISRAVRDAAQAARDAAEAATLQSTGLLPPPQALGGEEALKVLRAEIAGTKQEITALTQQLTIGLSGARENAIESQIDAATERLQSLQIQLDHLVTGRTTPIAVEPQEFPVPTVPPEVVTISIWFFATAAITLMSIPIIRAWARWLERRGQAAPPAPDVGPRLDRIEQAIEAVAIEVERVSEGQRFTNKLMGDLRGLPAPAQGQWPGAAAREPIMARREEG
ncbi:MAG: hypothetical protein ACT4P7_23010 [Gemmatimonadaceae bacterium]